jgi:hypothetical protein
MRAESAKRRTRAVGREAELALLGGFLDGVSSGGSLVLTGGPGIYSPPLTLGFSDGSMWRLQVPLPSKKHAKEVVRVLGYA